MDEGAFILGKTSDIYHKKVCSSVFEWKCYIDVLM